MPCIRIIFKIFRFGYAARLAVFEQIWLRFQALSFIYSLFLLSAFFVYNLVMHYWYSPVFSAFDAFLYEKSAKPNDRIPLLQSVAFRGTLHVAMLLFTLHLLDRQVCS